jgi:REP element-mobilizing transposase RayT
MANRGHLAGKLTQLDLPLRRRGGVRKGAGRKPNGARAGASHHPRLCKRDAPLHVTVRMRKHVYNLRSRRCFTQLARAFSGGRDRFGFRLVHFAVLGNHIHLLCEAEEARALGRGMKGLGVRIARRLNKIMNKRGAVLADRYHSRMLTTPAEVRRALVYLRDNAKHHRLDYEGIRQSVADDCTALAEVFELIVAPRCWLLRVGWRRRAGVRNRLSAPASKMQ